MPIEGVILTDAELDHSLGVVLLREARRMPLFATAQILRVLEQDSHILPVTRAFADVPATVLALNAAAPLTNSDGSPSGLSVEAFPVPAGPPRFATIDAEGHTVGLFVREDGTGRTCAFVPGCGGLSASLLGRLSGADALLFDGTFWTDDEPIAVGIGTQTAREMDHLPVGGRGGSLEPLGALPCRHRIYTHINNTNPILLEQSPERAAVTAAGLIVGYDGLYITL